MANNFILTPNGQIIQPQDGPSREEQAMLNAALSIQNSREKRYSENFYNAGAEKTREETESIKEARKRRQLVAQQDYADRMAKYYREVEKLDPQTAYNKAATMASIRYGNNIMNPDYVPPEQPKPARDPGWLKKLAISIGDIVEDVGEWMF